MTAAARAPGTVARMARITWYRHRPAMTAITGVFAVAVAVLLTEGLGMRSVISGQGLSRCLGTSVYGGVCGYGQPLASLTSQWDIFLNRPYYAADLMEVLNLLPLVVAMFAGIPWLTREFETGSFRFTWVQGMSRRQWLLGTFGPLVATAAVAAVVCGLVFEWWFQVAQWTANDYPYGGWSWVPFGLSPLTLTGWTIFAMALALPIALLVRRTVLAMGCCAVAFVACFTLVNRQLRDWLVTLAPAVAKSQYGGITAARSWNALYLRSWVTGPGGAPASGTVMGKLNSMTGVQADRWIAQHGYTYWVAYQPHDRLQLFQFAVMAVLLILALVLTLAAVWLLPRRAGDLPELVQVSKLVQVGLKQRRGTGGCSGTYRPCRSRKPANQPGSARIWP